jgi:hypothetical protein
MPLVRRFLWKVGSVAAPSWVSAATDPALRARLNRHSLSGRRFDTNAALGRLLQGLAVLTGLVWTHAVWGAGELPRRLAPAVLAESSSAAFSPADFTVSDYSLTWVGPLPPRVSAALEPGSLEWVRVRGAFSLPRAVVTIRAEGVEKGTVEHAGVSHPLRVDHHGTGTLELPVALLSGPSHGLRLRIRRSGSEQVGTLVVRFAPRTEHRGAVLIDVSCSPYAVRVRRGRIPGDSWLEVACRPLSVSRDGRRTAALELVTYWDNIGAAVEAEGIETRSEPTGVFRFRIRSDPGTLHLAARGREVVLGARVPAVLHAGFVGAGIGPYLYHFEDPETRLRTGTNLLTLYAGYSLGATTRIVYFNATPLHVRSFADQGLYLWTEQFALLDRRLTVNLLLGMHSLLFQSTGKLRFVPSFPQGLEAIFLDFGARAHNLNGGAFFYPQIQGRSYYNLWLRWGSARLFWEVNYIAWKEPLAVGFARTESLGISVGMPLLRLF